MSAIDPLACERCGRRLESDDAISVIEGVCGVCRNTAQSLVQPRRADELLMTRRISDEADDFLADLPKIEPWSPSPIPSEPWLVDEASARRERVSASVASFLGDDTDDDIEDATTDEAPAEAECESLEFDDEEASDVAPMIPPGPFAAVRRRGPAIKNPVETVSEIFDDGIPPSEPFVADADEDASDASDRVDIHRFTPPPMDFPRAGAPKRRRRKRAVTIGVCFGVLLTAAAGWLASDKAMRQRVMAWVNEIRQIEPDVVTDEPIQLSFLIDPPNAEVRLDGVRLEPSETSGRVELSVTVNTMDDRRLEVSAPGYHTKSQTLRDFRGIDEIVMQLTHLPFEAEIATDPPGAEIFLEGQLVGVSPVQVTIDPEVGAEVVARMSGYKPVSRTLRAPEEGESLQMRVPLEPAGVRLAIDTAPVPAQIWVNDRLFGMAPMDVDLDYHFLGQDVEIVARAEGFDDARMTIPMPSVGGDEMDASIQLERTMARLNVRTEPSGGRVILAGRDYGNAPVMVEFEPTETGKQVVIDTSLNGQYFGRQSVTIPAAGGPRECVIPMSFSAQRVVFIIAASRRAQADQYLLADALATRIERLDATQRFAVLASTDDGIEAWPFEVAFESATSEQKVRAYDMVRSIRSADSVDLEALLASAVQLDPTTIWLFTETSDRSALEKLSEALGDRDVSINLVTARTAQNDVWLDGYAARHRGVFETLDEAVAATGEMGE